GPRPVRRRRPPGGASRSIPAPSGLRATSTGPPASTTQAGCSAARGSGWRCFRRWARSGSISGTASTRSIAGAIRGPAGSCISSSATSSRPGRYTHVRSRTMVRGSFGRWLVLALALAGAPAALNAQKVGYINARAILLATPGYAQAESTYNRELAGFRGEVDRLQNSLDSAAADF